MLGVFVCVREREREEFKITPRFCPRYWKDGLVLCALLRQAERAGGCGSHSCSHQSAQLSAF